MICLELLGFSAGFFSIIAFVPQVYKTWKMKSADDVSIHMFIIYALSRLLWITYGMIISKYSIYLTNAIVLILSVIQIMLKIKYDRQNKAIGKYHKN